MTPPLPDYDYYLDQPSHNEIPLSSLVSYIFHVVSVVHRVLHWEHIYMECPAYPTKRRWTNDCYNVASCCKFLPVLLVPHPVWKSDRRLSCRWLLCKWLWAFLDTLKEERQGSLTAGIILEGRQKKLMYSECVQASCCLADFSVLFPLMDVFAQHYFWDEEDN